MWTICPNRAACPGQLFQAVKHFVSRGAMDIEGLGEKQAERFLSDGLIGGLADIYELDAERLLDLEGFGEVSARNLLEAIERSKEQPFNRVLYGLGIPGIGYVNARALTGHFRSIDALLDGLPRGRSPRRRGSARCWPQTIAETLDEDVTRELIAAPARATACSSRRRARHPREAEGPLAGKTLVLTGTLPNLTREEATERIEAAGRQGDRLGVEEDRLRGGRRGPRHKLAKAEKVGTEVLDEDGLLELLERKR